jgi:hypothetical protein
MPRPGATLTEPSSLAFALRGDAAYSIRAVRGLEVTGALLFSMSPSTAFALGAGAQMSFPATSRGRFRGTAGATLGLYQGLSGAQITTVWLGAQARAEYALSATVAFTAGVSLDIAPGSNGGVVTLAATAGVRLRLGR